MKTLIAYYSAEGHTRKLAKEIAKNLNADIYEIAPEKPYTKDDLDWTNPDSRASQENDNPELREMNIKNPNIPDWETYERVILCYPIWWGVAAWPVDAFVKSKDWSDKIIIPVCTSHSSGIGESDLLLKDIAGSGSWKDGVRFFQDALPAKIKDFCDAL